MTILAFCSDETGAPVLAGTVGALTDLLYACLVTGFNLVTLDSLNRDGTTVTGTLSTGHGFASGQTVRIAGANEPEYNGDVVVTVLSSTQFTYQITGTPTTPATGTITAKRAPLGWSRPYSGTNKAVFQGAAGTQFCLRVDDAASGAGGAKEALCRGYEAMTDVDTGTGPFPTTAQLANGVVWRKSDAASASTRAWNIIGDDRLFYLSIQSYSTPGTCRQFCYFGDIVSCKAGDNYGCAIAGKNGVNTGYTVSTGIYGAAQNNMANTDFYLARSHTQVGSSVCFRHGTLYYEGNDLLYLSGAEGYTGANPADLGYYMHPVLVQEVGSIRGKLPGVWGLPFVRPFQHWDTLENVENLDGRILRAINIGNGQGENSGSYGLFMLDITGPWR